METFIKTPVNELPKEAGWYYTEHSDLNPSRAIHEFDGKKWSSKELLYWLKPIQPEAISLEEAKERVLTEIGVDTWKDLIEERQEYYVDECEKKAAQLYLSQNTAALRQELETLKSLTIGFTEKELETLGHFKAMHETICDENKILRQKLERMTSENIRLIEQQLDVLWEIDADEAGLSKEDQEKIKGMADKVIKSAEKDKAYVDGLEQQVKALAEALKKVYPILKDNSFKPDNHEEREGVRIINQALSTLNN